MYACKRLGVRALALLRSRSSESSPRQSRGTGGQSLGLGSTEEGGRAERDAEKMESPHQIPQGQGVSGV